MLVREVVFVGEKQVELRERQAEMAPAPNQVLLKTLFSFVSTGTERAKLTGLQKIGYPWVAGNRAVGEVLAVGSAITDVRPGDRVLTHTPHASHALTDAFRVAVPDEVPLPQAAATALALVAMTALRVSPPELGDRVVVVGLGPVGMIAAQLYEAAGVEVIGVDRDAGRLALAKELGISHTVTAGREATEAVRAHTGPEGARIVIEATGIPSVVAQCFDFARQGGELVLLGSPRGELVTDVTPILERMHLWRPHSSVTVKGAHEWQFPTYRTPFSRHSIAENALAIFSLIARAGSTCRASPTTSFPPPRRRRPMRACWPTRHTGPASFRLDHAMIPLAYGTYGLGTVPLDVALPALAAAGYEGVELTLAEGYPDVSTRIDAERGARIAEQIRNAGLTLTAILAKATVLGTPERPGLSDADLADLMVSARNCGSDRPIVTFTMGGTHAEWPERREALVTRLRDLAAVAHAEGGVLAVEPHARGLIDSVDRAEWLMQAVDDPAMRLNFDISHYALPGHDFDLADAVRRLLPVSVHAHIKDSVPEGDGFRFVLPGEGPCDLAAYFAALAGVGWDKPVTVEVSAMVFNAPGYRPMTAIDTTFAALDRARRTAAARAA